MLSMVPIENNLKVSVPWIDQAELGAAATHGLGINIYIIATNDLIYM